MTQNISAVRSVVLPLSEVLVLLPGSVVAEIVPYAEPSPPPVGAPDWLIGISSWREQRVPLVSLDAFLSGGAAVPTGGRARIAILKAVGDAGGLSYYGVVTQQIPHLANVQPDAVEAVPVANETRVGVAAQLLLNGEPMIVPDVDSIEAAVRDALRKSA